MTDYEFEFGSEPCLVAAILEARKFQSVSPDEEERHQLALVDLRFQMDLLYRETPPGVTKGQFWGGVNVERAGILVDALGGGTVTPSCVVDVEPLSDLLMQGDVIVTGMAPEPVNEPHSIYIDGLSSRRLINRIHVRDQLGGLEGIIAVGQIQGVNVLKIAWED